MAKSKSQKSLSQWTKEDWKTKSGKPSGKTGERYLPAKAIKSLSNSEYAATTKAKRKGTQAGEQFVPQPKKVAEKVKPFRASKGGTTMKKGMHKMPDGSMMKDSDMKSGYMYGGMAKAKPMKAKSGYNMGGSVQGYGKGGYANCGASVPGTQRRSK